MASDTPRSETASGPAGSQTGSAASAGTASTGAGTAKGEPDLQVQISRLREDVAGLTEALKAKGNSSRENARQTAYQLRDDLRDRSERYYQQAQDAAHDLEDQLSERVRSEPIKSLAIAAAVGYLYARLFR